MLTSERPGVFIGRAYNTESWYVIDTTYAQFEKQVVAEWRARYRGTNRPAWVRPVLFTALPLLVFGISFAAVLASPADTRMVFPLALIVGLAMFVLGLRLADLRWPGKPAVEGHIHSVVPVHPELAAAATDSTPWNDLWEVSVGLYRALQADALTVNLAELLEVTHAPEERRILTEAHAAIDALRATRDAEFAATAEWSTMFHKRLGIPDNGEYL